MNREENILKQFFKQGFVEVKNKKNPSEIKWLPDLIVTKNSLNYYVLLRTNNSILPSFLSRISNSSSKYNSLIIFEKKCSKNDEKEILSMGISVGYFIDNKLSIKIRTQNKSVAREASKKLQVIDIFVSSKQDIEERKFTLERLEKLRKINEYPFSPPHLIEYDKFDIRKLYPYIDSIMDKCDWIVIILEDNYSEVVSYEIHRAMNSIKHENIFMFVKSTKECQSFWRKELDHIISLKPATIKYLPYSDLDDLEVSMSRAIHLRMGQIYKKKKIKTTD